MPTSIVSCEYKWTAIQCDINESLIRVRVHLTSDKNSYIFQHIYWSETCRALYSENCFLILDTASTSFYLKTKEALHIGWENPSLNKQVNYVNLTLSFKFSVLNTIAFLSLYFLAPYIHVVI